jgi:hypothetical protein
VTETTATAADLFPVAAVAAAGVATFFAAGAYGMTRAASTMWGPVLSRGRPTAARLALTFDDGPLPGTTDRVLDDLRDAGVRAAFFVIGRHAEQWPDLVRRMHDEGHLVGNHSHEHLHTGLLGRYPTGCASCGAATTRSSRSSAAGRRCCARRWATSTGT